MILIAQEVLNVLVRWLHIVSAALLVGGLAYARAVAVPALETLPDEERAEAWRRLAWRFRPMVYAAIAGLLVSGVYNLLVHPGHTVFYHRLFGVKILLAAHVFAASVLAVKEPKPSRMTSAAISGILVLLLAAYLRRIF
jgi:uncharacterized membrane protein